jgi:uncharacterized protein YbjT (DUF2867 family)
MKYVITGSLGHISKPVVEALVKAGHDVTVISSNSGKATEIEGYGAKAAIGSVTDQSFLNEVFKNADAAYLMIPPNFAAPDFLQYQKTVATNYFEALQQSSIQHVVVLSSIGAHLRKGAGPIDGLAFLEELLLKSKASVKILRPGYFFYNLHQMAGMLKQGGIVGSNFGDANEKIALVHHLDIADKVLKHLSSLSFTGYSVEYVVSDERYAGEIATLLGQSVGKQEVPWVVFTDEDTLQGMLQHGINPSLAEAYKTMGKAFREGRAQEDYWKHRPQLSGSRKLEEFTKEFAAVYNQN